MGNEMFCRQCEQALGSKACTDKGVCGKDPDTGLLQDLLIHSVKGVSVYANLARGLGIKDEGVDKFVIEALFTTITNVNFDSKNIEQLIYQSEKVKEKIKNIFLDAYKSKEGKNYDGKLPQITNWVAKDGLDNLIAQASSLTSASLELNEDVKSLGEILLYGLKGVAAYADHALVLGKKNDEVDDFFHKALSVLAGDSLEGDELLGLVLECGKVNLTCMEILDTAHTEHFGNPVPTKVKCGLSKGPAIVVSGHDLLDLERLLIQTEGKGINVYTHSEMLPAHGYPALNKYSHLKGNFGGAWQDQQKEFNGFKGAILMTTNCIQKPSDSYNDRIFTTGLVAFEGLNHIALVDDKKDFTSLIDKALELGGYEEETLEKEILVGFGHNAVLGVADKVIEAVKAGQIKHFFLVGGCDGAKPGRNYYTEFAEKVPQDCVILTLACGKYRFNKLDFGDIGGIPRLLDCGQCNDAYSAIKIASALASAFDCGVNDLPLSLILSWYEQKAVCILLSLLYLGITNIRLGPSLPAFISDGVLKVLVEKFNIAPIKTADEDLTDILGEVYTKSKTVA